MPFIYNRNGKSLNAIQIINQIQKLNKNYENC